MPRLQLDTLRLLLIKVGDKVRESLTKVRSRLATSPPSQSLWGLLATRLQRT